MGEELDDGELLPRGGEEGVEAGGVEVDGVVPLRGGPVADAQRPEGVPPPREGEDEEEDGAEGHGSAGGLDLAGEVGDPAIRFGHPRRSRADQTSSSTTTARRLRLGFI